MFTENTAVLATASQQKTNARTEHIDVIIHYVKHLSYCGHDPSYLYSKHQTSLTTGLRSLLAVGQSQIFVHISWY